MSPPDPKVAGWLFMHPSPRIRTPLPVADIEIFTEGLTAAYEEAVHAVNAELWGAAAVSARRTLEGIAKSLLPDAARRRTLNQLLRQLPDHVDLAEPITAVADLLREGGNLGAHFSLETPPPDEEIAREMLELLDDLIEYLFLLPRNVARVRARLEDHRPPRAPDPAE